MALALLAAIGVAVDTMRSIKMKQAAQDSLDAAVIAAATASDAENAKRAFNAFLRSQGSSGKVDFNWSSNNGRIVATAERSFAVPTTVMKLFGVGDVTVSVASEAAAPKRLSELEITLREAYGWFNKDVEFWVERPDGTQEVVATIKYEMTDKTGAKDRGTGRTTISPSPVVSLGLWKKIWISMTVHADSSSFTFKTADPQTVDRIFINGQQLPAGTVPPLSAILPCDSHIPFSLEDAADYQARNWALQDIFFEVDTRCEGSDVSRVALTK